MIILVFRVITLSNTTKTLTADYIFFTRAPQGCLQYFTGLKNTVTSFNFDGTLGTTTGGELANQDYRVCFRQEAGKWFIM